MATEQEEWTGKSSNGPILPRTPILPPGPVQLYNPAIGGLNLQSKLYRPSYYTVQFELTLVDAPGRTVNGLKALAEVTWTVKGNPVRRLISVYSGTVISGGGEYVNVNLVDDSEPGALQGATYNATINLALGARPSTGMPPTLFSRAVSVLSGSTYPPYTLPAGGAIAIAVPQNAGVNQVLIDAVQSAGSVAELPNDIIISHNAGAVLMQRYNLSSGSRFIPLAPGSTTVSLNSRSAVDYQITPIWGVEG